MLKLMADNDVTGHVRILTQICESEPWTEVWKDLDCRLLAFADLNLSHNDPDEEIWHACQKNGVILITANRNADGPDSLEVIIRQEKSRELPPGDHSRRSRTFPSRAPVRGSSL